MNKKMCYRKRDRKGNKKNNNFHGNNSHPQIEKEPTHIISIDESGNGDGNGPLYVAHIAKYSKDLVRFENNLEKLRPKSKNTKKRYIQFMNDLRKGRNNLDWFVFCKHPNIDYDYKSKTILTLSCLIRYIEENYINLNDTNIYIDGTEIKTKTGVSLIGFLDPFGKENIKINFELQGDEHYKGLNIADVISHILCYKDMDWENFDRNYLDINSVLQRYVHEGKIGFKV